MIINKKDLERYKELISVLPAEGQSLAMRFQPGDVIVISGVKYFVIGVAQLKSTKQWTVALSIFDPKLDFQKAMSNRVGYNPNSLDDLVIPENN